MLLGIALQRREMVVENQLLLIEQAADQRRFAVVDRAASQQAKGRQRRHAKVVHQK
jgi:hypothetical protein